MPQTQGPFIFENWKAHSSGAEMRTAQEFPLYTDAHITGDQPEGLGPQKLFNTIAFQARHAPRMVLRLAFHLDGNAVPAMTSTNTDNYLIGNYGNHFAALAGLQMGIRLRAADATRQFGPPLANDDLGRPLMLGEEYVVDLPTTNKRPRLPRCKGTHNLNQELIRLPTFVDLPPEIASAILKCAYLYQDSLWHAESDPNTSWISLVSAVETAANVWRTEREPPMERFAVSHPELLELLRQKGDEAWVTSIANYLDRYLGATKKFVDFVIAFIPEPPSPRTDVWHQHRWDDASLKKSLKIIYSWRSKALHGGVPFPSPMFDSPWTDGDAVAEVPVGLAAAANGGEWVARDTPMLLHTFEHIVRGALQKWWAACIERGPSSRSTDAVTGT